MMMTPQDPSYLETDQPDTKTRPNPSSAPFRLVQQLWVSGSFAKKTVQKTITRAPVLKIAATVIWAACIFVVMYNLGFLSFLFGKSTEKETEEPSNEGPHETGDHSSSPSHSTNSTNSTNSANSTNSTNSINSINSTHSSVTSVSQPAQAHGRRILQASPTLAF